MVKKKKSKFLNLTPLIDVMTTLIIFILIQSSDSVVRVDDKIKLPTNNFGDNVEKNENLIVSLKDIKIGKKFRLDLKKGHVNSRHLHKEEDKLIKPLYKQILALRESNEEKDFNMNFTFDKRLPADSVKKIIYTATVAGVDNIFYIGESNQ